MARETCPAMLMIIWRPARRRASLVFSLSPPFARWFRRPRQHTRKLATGVATRHCPVPVLSRRAKTSFPGRKDHSAALRGPFPPGGRKNWLGRSRLRQRQGSRPRWSAPDFPRGIVPTREPCSTFRMDSLDSFVDTFSGLRFWPLDPNPDDILIADIAHALAHQCRFGGHASKFYSVAEHSVHVSQLCFPEHALWGLLHDASEAYLVDLPRPLKQLPEFAPYREAERRLQYAVAVRFGLSEDQPASVTEADDTMLWIEAHSLLVSAAVEVIRDTRPPFEITNPLPPVEAERLFLRRFKELTA